MSRKGCPNKKQSGITYPRKCNCCDYISNNPAMYSYHKKTHEPIPVGQLCDHGCGQHAIYFNTNGKYSCSKIVQHCPEYIRQHSERVKTYWARPEAIERKETTKKTFLECCANNNDVQNRRKDTIKHKWGNFTPAQMKDYRHYARRIRQRAQTWAKNNGYCLGQQTFHVDHRLSIWDAYQAGLPEQIVNNPVNLQILEAKKNSSKGAKSLLTVDELLALIASTQLK